MADRHPETPPPARRDDLLAFFALTFLVTWASWFVASRLGAAPSRSSWLATVLFGLGVGAPAIVALALAFRRAGRSGARTLLGRLVQWDVPGRWYLFAITYMAAIKLTAAVVHRVAFGVWPRFGEHPWYLLVAAALLSTVVGGQIGEELGWRGHALPRMASRFGLGLSGVVLGVIWAVWHLPLFFWFPAADTYHQSFLFYLLQVVPVSVAIAWLYGHTRGSLLPVMLMHAAINNTKDIVPSTLTPTTGVFEWNSTPMGSITLVLLWVCAAAFLLRMPPVAAARDDVAERQPAMRS